MNTLSDKAVDAGAFAWRRGVGVAARRRLGSNFAVRPPRVAAQTALRSENWRRRSEKWDRLMVAAQGGQSRAYEQLLREIDAWLLRHYARRLPRAAAEDARQKALLAIHAKRETYSPSRPFAPWIRAIERHKWIGRVRDAYRFAALLLHDEIPIENRGEPPINAVVVDDLLRQLKPAQARVIRLVKLQGISVEDASGATSILSSRQGQHQSRSKETSGAREKFLRPRADVIAAADSIAALVRASEA